MPPTATAPSGNRFRAHLVTWAIVVFIVGFHVIVHSLASTETSVGRVIRACFRAGDPKGPGTSGFAHALFVTVVTVSTAWTLAHRYCRSPLPGFVITFTVASFYAFTLTLFPEVIADAHPDFPMHAVWRTLPLFVLFSGAGCLFGAATAGVGGPES
jgi:hypothetical protein